MANVDASKGEHGLKKWAKLPSKTVRVRSAHYYYKDLATRIYQNRLIEIGMDTLVQHRADIAKVAEETGEDADCEVRIELSNSLLMLQRVGPSPLNEDVVVALRSKSNNLMFPLHLFEEAHFISNEHGKRTIRSCPDYRSTGPWRDWVLVRYRDRQDNLVKYPYQVYALFESRGKKQALGRMGQRKRISESKLSCHWTFESEMRIVDLDIIGEQAFVILIPPDCCRQGSQARESFLVFEDRIQEWPCIFETNWNTDVKTKKRKKRNGMC
jgi:hypothetical protein